MKIISFLIFFCIFFHNPEGKTATYFFLKSKSTDETFKYVIGVHIKTKQLIEEKTNTFAI